MALRIETFSITLASSSDPDILVPIILEQALEVRLEGCFKLLRWAIVQVISSTAGQSLVIEGAYITN